VSSLPWHRPELRAHRISLAVGIVLFVSAALWVLGLPGVSLLPAWFYQPLGPRALDPSGWVLVGLAVPGLGYAAFRSAKAGRTGRALVLLLATSLAAQTMVLALDRGTLIYRLEQGHGEFFRIAHERRGAYLETMRDYEALSEAGTLGGFAPSKPPGTLSFYMLVDALGDLTPIRILSGPIVSELEMRPLLSSRAEGAAAGALLLPFLTALALIPLFFVARRLGGSPEDGVAAGMVFLTAPGMLLINYHADGALFPLLTMLVVALAVHACRQVGRTQQRMWLVGAGLALALGIWCNFSTLPLVGFLGVLFFVLRAEAGASPKEALWRSVVDLLIVSVAAFALLALFAAVGLFSHPIDRFFAALEHHRRWKSDAIGGVFGLVGAIEYWLWAGLPLLVVSLFGFGGAVRRLISWTPRPGDGVVLAVFVVHIVMAVFTGCVEAARLWLWVTPLFALAASRFLRAEGPTGAPEQLWVQLAGSQLVLTVLMRFCQPW
jgi:hypothetical protein